MLAWTGRRKTSLRSARLVVDGVGRGHLGSLDPRHIDTPSLLDALLLGHLLPSLVPLGFWLLLGWSSCHTGLGAGWVPRKGPLIALVDRYLACPVFSVMLGTV